VPPRECDSYYLRTNPCHLGKAKDQRSLPCTGGAHKCMKMNDWSVPICGLKPAATADPLSSGGGLQPALPLVIFGTEDAEEVYSKAKILCALRPNCVKAFRLQLCRFVSFVAAFGLYCLNCSNPVDVWRGIPCYGILSSLVFA